MVWTTESFPVSNTGDADEGLRKVGTTLKNGTVFRVVEFAPGVAPRNHRTDSIDYAVVVSGEIDMELDDSVAHLKAGDVLVQRGTIHNWVNRGTQPCVMAFILIDAKPVEADAKVLNAVGCSAHQNEHGRRNRLNSGMGTGAHSASSMRSSMPSVRHTNLMRSERVSGCEISCCECHY